MSTETARPVAAADHEMPGVVAHDVFCLYPTPRGYVAALRGLTLEVAPRERVVVHGPNGSGKTTLLRVLSGELPPSAGLVRVAGVDLVGAEDAERVAYSAQCVAAVVVSTPAGIFTVNRLPFTSTCRLPLPASTR